MSENTSVLQKYTQRFHTESSPKIIVELIAEVENLCETGVISNNERLEVQILGYKNLRELYFEVQFWDEIEDIILNSLLPECFINDSESRVVIQYRDLLKDWLDQYPDDFRNQIRDKVFEDLLQRTKNNPTESILTTFSVLGYRTTKIFNTLWELVESNDNLSDKALVTLSWLGVPSEKLNIFINELNKGAQNRYNNHLLWALARYGNKKSVEIICEYWLDPQQTKNLNVDVSLAFTAIREILNRCDEDTEYQDRIWSRLVNIVEINPEKLYWDFDIGHIPSACNSSLVVPQLLNWAGNNPRWFKNPSWTRHLSALRLEECVKPNQMRGWARIISQEVLDAYKLDACQNTKNDGFFTTSENSVKKTAWETLLRLGYSDVLNWFGEAIAVEDGRFTQQAVMNFLSCFHLDSLPSQSVIWVKEIYDDQDESDGRELSRRMAATQLLRSTASLDAFDVLVNFGYTRDGQILLQSTNAISEVALHLIEHGHNSVIQTLVDKISNPSEYRIRLAAAGALEEIAIRKPQLVKKYVNDIIAVVLDEKREDIERGTLLTCLGHITGWNIPTKLIKKLLDWAPKFDRWLGGGSMYLLTNHRMIENYPELVKKTLKLQLRDNNYELLDNEQTFEWAPYIIGILYSQNVDAYASVVASLLDTNDWRIASQIIRQLQYVHRENRVVPDEVMNALINRAMYRQSTIYSETEVFRFLAEVAPDTLAETEWEQVLTKWMPNAQVELADALGKAAISSGYIGKSLQKLEILAANSVYAVRRAAYRSIANISQEHLYQLCEYWFQDSSLEFNLRASEACGWLDDEIEDKKGFAIIHDGVSTHPERRVRETAKITWEERRQRIWSEQYLEIALQVKGNSNQDVFDAWCYGEALTQVGDDDTKIRLNHHIANETLPPNVRYWLRRIYKNLEKKWKQKTQKWPDPWIDLSGMIEIGSGKLRTGTQVIDVQYSINLRAAAEPSELHSWSGIITPVSFFDYIKYFQKLDYANIVLENGSEGKIFISGMTGSTISFSGTGPYPS